VDFAMALPAAPLKDQTLRFTSDSDIVRQVRLAKAANRATRVVLDASGVSTYSIYALYDPFRLVIDCVRGPRAAPPPLPLAGKSLVFATARTLPRTLPRSTPMQLALALAAEPPVTTSYSTLAAERNTTGGFS